MPNAKHQSNSMQRILNKTEHFCSFAMLIMATVSMHPAVKGSDFGKLGHFSVLPTSVYSTQGNTGGL